ncbi:MAG: saccharopine dehydrogenase NADP-binding domain-containing protein [Pseudomonadota bacterium]
MRNDREFDVVVMGATGFTGRLVAQYLLKRHGIAGAFKWALAGRSQDKLEQIRAELGDAAVDLPLIVADSHDSASLDAMVERTRVVCTTVGPYAFYGADLVEACAAHGTDYCDLSGEVPWMRRMLDRHADAAQQSGARIVHCCGFDSIPSDMGVFFLQQQAMAKFGQPLNRVRLRVKAAKGGLSGGTYASMLNIVDESHHDKDIHRIMTNPYSLCPPEHRKGERQPYVHGPKLDRSLNSWMAPFIMAAVNTRVVHKSNALRDHVYGTDFRYDEAVLTGSGISGQLKAITVSAGMAAFAFGSGIRLTQKLMKKFMLPKPGEGPNAEQREAGFYNLIVEGSTADGQKLRARVKGDRDPGYGSTSKMLGEAAFTLAHLSPEEKPGGFWTPSTALGDSLLTALTEHAGLEFAIES